MALIRGTSLQGFPELVSELGADPGPILAAVGIPRAAVGSQDAYISYLSALRAIESGADITGARDFGRRLALRQGIEILGPLAAAAYTAPTAEAAIRAVLQYLAVYSPAITATLDAPPGEELARFEFRIVLDHLPPHRQVTELALGLTISITRVVIPGFTPVSVHVPHDPLTPVADYERYFAGPVRFAQPFTGFMLRSADLARPLPSDSAVHDVVHQYLRAIAPAPDGTASGPVRTLVRRLLATGTMDRDFIAAQLSLHPRTLQRRLTAEGTTFNELVEAVRREEAERYLRDTDMPLGQLAALLGYSEQSVLTRACRRWFGTSGTAQRQALRGQSQFNGVTSASLATGGLR